MNKSRQNGLRRSLVQNGDFKLDYFYCTSCKKIPLLRYKPVQNYVEIRCRNCNPNVAVLVLLENFLKDIDRPKHLPECSNTDIHGDALGAAYCTDTCKKFYCLPCLDNHNEENKDHFVVNSDGLVIHSVCEMQDCRTQDFIKYFCRECNLHLCDDCRKYHDKSHKLINIHDFFKNDEVTKENIKRIEQWDRSVESFYRPAEEAVADLEKRVRSIKKYLAETKEEDKKILTFLKSLISTYDSTYKAPNFNVRYNLYDNQVDKILAEKMKMIKQRFAQEINESKFGTFIKGNQGKTNEFQKELMKAQKSALLTIPASEPQQPKIKQQPLKQQPPRLKFFQASDSIEGEIKQPKKIDLKPICLNDAIEGVEKKQPDLKKLSLNDCVEGVKVEKEPEPEPPKEKLRAKKNAGNDDITLVQEIENKNIGKSISCLLVTKDNKVFTGGQDNNIYAYKYSLDQQAFNYDNTLKGHSSWVNSLCSMDDDKYILSGSNDNTIKQWTNDSNYDCVRTIEGHENTVYKVIQLSDRNIASGSKDTTIKVWTPEGKIIKTLRGNTNGVSQLIEIPNNVLVSGSNDDIILFWDLNTYECLKDRTIKGYDIYSWGASLYYIEKENKLLVGGEGEIQVIDLNTNQLECTITENINDNGIVCMFELLDYSLVVGLGLIKDHLMIYDGTFKFKKNMNYPYDETVKHGVCYDAHNFITADTAGHLLVWGY